MWGKDKQLLSFHVNIKEKDFPKIKTLLASLHLLIKMNVSKTNC